MSGKNWFGVNRVAFVLTVAFSVLFLSYSVVSAVTYSKVTLAQQQIALEDPQRIAEVQPNGTLFIGFTVRIANPSGYDIRVSSMNWYSLIRNGTGNNVISLASNYTAENVGLTIPAGAVTNISLGWYLSDEDLAEVKGFINHSASLGLVYTLLTVPYAHSFEFTGWLDNFKHDYLRENYLNGLVTVDLTYTYGMEE
jgi:hypothetical protein